MRGHYFVYAVAGWLVVVVVILWVMLQSFFVLRSRCDDKVWPVCLSVSSSVAGLGEWPCREKSRGAELIAEDAGPSALGSEVEVVEARWSEMQME